jgi:hypothetical protein
MNNQSNNNEINGTPLQTNNLGNVTPNQNNDDIEVLGNTTVIPPITSQNNGLPEINNIGVNPINFDPPKKDNIGIIPPKKEKPPKDTKKKVLFVLLILILIAGVAAGVYFYLKIAKEKAIANEVKTNTITIELGSELSSDINTYASFNGVTSTNCVLDTSKVDKGTIGKYDYTITCGSNNYKGVLVIQDTVAPKVTLKDVTKTLNDSISPEDFINSCDDKSECKYLFNDEASVKTDMATAGTYTVMIKVEDTSGNNVVVTGNLNVVNGTIAAYLKCSSEYMLHSKYNATYHYLDSFGIDNGNNYLGIATREKIYVFLQASEYNTVKEQNEKNTSFDDTTGTLSWDDKQYSLTISSDLSKTTLDSEYGSTFPSTYNGIKSYYENKGYTCESVTK